MVSPRRFLILFWCLIEFSTNLLYSTCYSYIDVLVWTSCLLIYYILRVTTVASDVFLLKNWLLVLDLDVNMIEIDLLYLFRLYINFISFNRIMKILIWLYFPNCFEKEFPKKNSLQVFIMERYVCINILTLELSKNVYSTYERKSIHVNILLKKSILFL